MHYLWAALGLLSVGLGMAGAMLPLLPTVPFLLLAAFFFARSSERLHNWLMTHRQFGPMIADWQERGAIARRAKWVASLSILLAFGLSVAMGVRPTLLVVQAVVLAGVSAFIWSRPEA